MTTKEIAQAVGKAEKTVRTWASTIAANSAAIAAKIAASSSTHPADYDLTETCSIIEYGLGKNAADLYRMSAKSKQSESFLTQKDIALISQIVSATVAETIRQLDGRMSKIETKIEERKALLPAPHIKPRDHINMIVRGYCQKNRIDHSVAWGDLYKDFSYRTNTNPRLSAKNRNMTIIDYIDSEGMIETLESIALETMAI